MKKGNMKLTAICVAAGLVLCEGSLGVYAAGTEMVLAGLGDFSAAVSENNTTEESGDASYEETWSEETGNSSGEETWSEETGSASGEETWSEDADDASYEEEPGTEAETEIPFIPDKDSIGTTGFAMCDEYLNVRASAEKEGELVGKVYNFGAVEILDVDDNGWYKVRSGNVEGYVAGQYVATGSLAEEISADAGYTTAEVGADVLNLRADASQESDVIGHVTSDHEVEVIEDNGEWVKVYVDGIYGYVSSDYVNTTTEYATGETLEEEQQRLDEQWLAYLAEQEAIAQAQAAAYAQQQAYYNAVYTEPVYTEQAYTDASYSGQTYEQTYEQAYEQAYTDAYYEVYDDTAYNEAQSQADAASSLSYDAQVQAQEQYQVYVEAQNAADEAAANGDEQAINDTAAVAQAAYEQYVLAQDQADTAAQAEADALAQAQAEAEALAAAQAQAEAIAAEQAQAEAAAAQEAAYAEAAAQETYEDTSWQETSTDGSYQETYTDETYTDPSYQETYTDTSSYSGSSTGQSVADFATQFVGNPYVYGGSSLTGGADCSGFVMSVYSNFGISLPHNAAAQSGYGTSVSMDNLQPGDLLFYDGGGGIGHVSIYIGNGQVVHASNPSNGIMISDIGYRTPCAATRLV